MRLSIFLFVILANTATYGQTETSTNKNKMRGGLYMSVANLNFNALTELNEQLRLAGRPALGESLTGINLGFTQRFADQNSYVAVKFSYYTAYDNVEGNQNTQLQMWETSVTSHYDLLPNKRWLLYPYLGTGFNLTTLTLATITDSGSFQNSLSTTRQDEVIQQKYKLDSNLAFLDIGIGVERAFYLNQTNLYIGLSGGYRASFDRVWSIDGVKTFDDAPFNTRGLIFDFKLRLEPNENADTDPDRGLFKFFH